MQPSPPPPQVIRVAFNEITREAALHALAHPRSVSTPLVEAYLARRALDYVMGYGLSRVLGRKLPGSKSAGRVQSVALRLVTDREHAIRTIQQREYWSVDARCQGPHGTPSRRPSRTWTGSGWASLASSLPRSPSRSRPQEFQTFRRLQIGLSVLGASVEIRRGSKNVGQIAGMDCDSGFFPVLGGERSGGCLRRLAVPCPFLPRGHPAAVPHVRQRPPEVQVEQDGGLPGLQQLPQLHPQLPASRSPLAGTPPPPAQLCGTDCLLVPFLDLRCGCELLMTNNRVGTVDANSLQGRASRLELVDTWKMKNGN
jgi:hypothetical protein